MRIVIGADIVPTESNEKYFINGDVKELVGDDIHGILKKADLTVFNLEVPLADEETPIEKCGPNLIAHTNTIKGLKSINPGLFTLANNHILDQGLKGLESTMETLRSNDIGFAGAGNSIYEASRPFYFEKENIRVGIYCCAEHEFSIAEENKPGANPFDPLVSLDHIQQMKEECDYVIVLYHGGREHYRYPSPYLQKVCKRIVDKGASIVICQHTHCIGCEEKWNGGTIVYGQGNFLFDYSQSEYWKTGLLIDLVITKEDCSIQYIPISKKDSVVRKASKDDAYKILEDFKKRSAQIKEKSFVHTKYDELSQKELWSYLYRFSGRLVYLFVALDKISNGCLGKKLYKIIYKRRHILSIVNVIECEVHKELFSSAYKYY